MTRRFWLRLVVGLVVLAIGEAGHDKHSIQRLRTELVVRSSCARQQAALVAVPPKGKR